MRLFTYILMLVGVIAIANAQGSPPVADSFSNPVSNYSINGFNFDVNWFSTEQCAHGVVKRHCGVDLNAGSYGTPVYASADGLVRWAGYYSRDGKWADLVMLDHDVPGVGNVTSIYGHIDIAPGISAGRTVGRGTLIGTISKRLLTYGYQPHLHFGIRISAYDVDISRRGALPQCGRRESDPQFPGGFVDPTAFIRAHQGTTKPILAGNCTPHVTRDVNGNLVVLVRDNSGAIWCTRKSSMESGWSTWQNLGGSFSGDPQPNRNGQGRLEFFVLGTDGSVSCRWETSPGGPWSSGYTRFTGPVSFISNPAVCNNQDGRLQIFLTGLDSHVYTKWQTSIGGDWYPDWQDFGGSVIGDPEAALHNNGAQELFVRMSDRSIYTRYQAQVNGSWDAWGNHFGTALDSPRIGKNRLGRLQDFIRGTDQMIYNKWESADVGNWQGWGPVGPWMQFASRPSVDINKAGGLEVFARGLNNEVYHCWQDPGSLTWGSWYSLGGSINNEVGVSHVQDGRLEIFVRWSNGYTYHRWQQADLSWSEWQPL